MTNRKRADGRRSTKELEAIVAAAPTNWLWMHGFEKDALRELDERREFERGHDAGFPEDSEREFERGI